jgi:hypothetical protein
MMVQHLEESPADGVTGHLDSTSNGNDATPYNFQTGTGSTSATGHINGADDFAGDGDYLAAPSSTSLNISNQISIEAWVKPDDLQLSVVHRLIQKFRHTDNERQYSIELISDKLRFNLSDDGTYTPGLYDLTSVSTLSVGTWTHVMATSDGTNMRIYINGNQDANTEPAPSTIHTGPSELRIGKYDYAGITQYYDGIIDEVRIHDIALTDQEVKATTNSGNDTLFSYGAQESNGGGGGAVPEYTTPIAIALALGVGLVVVLVVRSRFIAKKKI